MIHTPVGNARFCNPYVTGEVLLQSPRPNMAFHIPIRPCARLQTVSRTSIPANRPISELYTWDQAQHSVHPAYVCTHGAWCKTCRTNEPRLYCNSASRRKHRPGAKQLAFKASQSVCSISGLPSAVVYPANNQVKLTAPNTRDQGLYCVSPTGNTGQIVRSFHSVITR